MKAGNVCWMKGPVLIPVAIYLSMPSWMWIACFMACRGPIGIFKVEPRPSVTNLYSFIACSHNTTFNLPILVWNLPMIEYLWVHVLHIIWMGRPSALANWKFGMLIVDTVAEVVPCLVTDDVVGICNICSLSPRLSAGDFVSYNADDLILSSCVTGDMHLESRPFLQYDIEVVWQLVL